MRLRYNKNRGIVVSSTMMADIAFVLFFANPALRTFLSGVYDNFIFVAVVDLIILYTPVLLLVSQNPRKYIIKDFLLLYIFLLVFIGITILVHPEYEPYFGSEMGDYSLWKYILIPYRGIYAYLFVRLVNDPDRLLKDTRISGWVMFLYFFYQLILYFRRGYWYGVGWGNNYNAQLSYSVSFGYDVLPFALTFTYSALKNKKLIDIVSAIICMVLILAGGSRGPIICIGIFAGLYITKVFQQSRKKFFYLLLVVVLTVTLLMTYEYILVGIGLIIERLGLSSRFITKLLSGEITEDSGRSRLWNMAIEMIKTNPLGYGALGSRHVIVPYIIAGYPHNVILEILIDYGVFIGSIIIITMLIGSIKMLFDYRNDEWSGIFLIFFCTASGLLLSLTYWRIPSFWASIAIGVNSIYGKKRAKKANR